MISSSIPTNTVLNIVVDTNQFLSVFVFRGMMMQAVFDLVRDKKIHLYISPALQDEIAEKLQCYKADEQIHNTVILFIKKRGILIEPTVKIDVCRDLEDNFVLELAETTEADYIITRDKDLLELPQGKWKSTKIMRSEEFLPLLRSLQLI